MPAAKAKSRATASRKRDLARTNIVLDRALVERVKKLSKARTTREAVQLALEHYAQSRDYSRVLALLGTGGVMPGYDPKGLEQQGG